MGTKSANMTKNETKLQKYTENTTEYINTASLTDQTSKITIQ